MDLSRQFPGTAVMMRQVGHILGAATGALQAAGKPLVFSGELGWNCQVPGLFDQVRL